MESAGPERQRVLIIDDTPDNIMVLTYLLRGECHLSTATSGEEALELVGHEPRPDLILLDVMMPGMDGYEVCERLKADPATRDIPVIFVTALSESGDETKGFRLGAVDYIIKPFSLPVVRARVRTHLVLASIRRTLANKNAQMEEERAFIESILLRMRQTERFDGAHLRSLLTPVEKTAGDMLLAAHRPDGVYHMLIGDFTGHGLSAAVAGPLLEDIFYTMTGKGLDMMDILAEVNLKLQRKLPVNVYLAAGFVEWRATDRRMRIVNAGLPELLLFRRGRLEREFRSLHHPLGIVAQDQALFSAVIEIIAEPGDLVYAYSDGIVETRSFQGEEFGKERLIAWLAQLIASGAGLEELRKELVRFRDGEGQLDDITMVELKCV